ncbi:MAG TPA: serine/threonine-protein kinase [Polyangiaceae bacterium]|nr:serine/threonine-protein kinase [Polyangiaceae bacterium]
MAERAGAPTQPMRLGRYVLLDAIAWGGMATVYVGKLNGPEGFRRTVAIKRPHPHLARDAEFAAMFLEEARLAARVRHLNVVPTLDVIDEGGEVAHVMEYVEGASLAELARQAGVMHHLPPVGIVARVVADLLEGLHAAHEAKDERGQPLGIVHRDVSPQNVLVGVDGLSRVLDFGVAKATSRQNYTGDQRIKGKLAYVAPEYVNGQPADRRSDLYSAAVIFWELATGQYLFAGQTEQETLSNILMQPPRALRQLRPDAPPALAAIVERALARDPDQRHPDARSFARDLKGAIELASHEDVGAWVRALAAEPLAVNAAILARAEAVMTSGVHPAPAPAPAADPPSSAKTLVLAPSPQPAPTPPVAQPPPPPEARGPESSDGAPPAAFAIADAPSRGMTLRGLSSQPALGPAQRSGPGLPLFAIGLAASVAMGAGLAHFWQGNLPLENAIPKASAARPLSSELAVAPPPPEPAAAAPPVKPTSTGSGAAPGASARTAASPPSAQPAPPASPAQPRKSATPPPPPPKPKPPAKQGPGTNATCDPPFTYDAAGIRRIKPQCL